MPLTKAERIHYDRLRFQLKQLMSTHDALLLIRDAKKNFKRQVSAGTTAEELFQEDFSKVYNTPAMARELEHLPQQLIPNAPTDEVESKYLTLTKSERAVEVEKLTQKLKFLETLDKNDDIRANQYIKDVLIALDMKVKLKEAEKATLKTRQTLTKSSSTKDSEDRPSSTIWGSLFGSSSSSKRARTNDDDA